MISAPQHRSSCKNSVITPSRDLFVLCCNIVKQPSFIAPLYYRGSAWPLQLRVARLLPWLASSSASPSSSSLPFIVTVTLLWAPVDELVMSPKTLLPQRICTRTSFPLGFDFPGEGIFGCLPLALMATRVALALALTSLFAIMVSVDLHGRPLRAPVEGFCWLLLCVRDEVSRGLGPSPLPWRRPPLSVSTP